jgi:hypothetical protein
MKVSYQTVEGLKMIQERYFFGMFSGSPHLEIADEGKEYLMRDALTDAINTLESMLPSLFDMEGGARGEPYPAPLPEIDVDGEGA